MPLQRENAGEISEVIVIEKPFLTRPHLFELEDVSDQDDRLSSLPVYQQIVLLREALRPFAELAELFRSPDGGKAVFAMHFAPGRWCELTIDDFRRAKTALAATED